MAHGGLFCIGGRSLSVVPASILNSVQSAHPARIRPELIA